MATDLNSVFVLGRLTRDPELNQTSGGTAYCRFSIANNRNYVQNMEKKEEVSYFNCVAWAKQAEILNQYCHKGKQIAIQGRLKQNSWDNKEGKRQYSVDIVVENFQLLGNVGGQGQGGAQAYSNQSPQSSSSTSAHEGGASAELSQVDPSTVVSSNNEIDDDDIPF